MTAPRAAAGLVLLVLTGCGSATGTTAGAAAPPAVSAPASPPSAPPPSAPPPSVPAAGGHRDDYDAPVEELVDHADHLDLDRLSPARREALEQELARRGAVGEQLWSAYGERLGAPAAVRSLAVQELAFVLLAARADQLAGAVDQAGGLGRARALPEVGTEADGVEVRMAKECVAVTWSGDEFGRSFGVTVGEQAGGTLRERLQRVRVAGPGEDACDGGPVSLSPDAERALG